MKTQEKVIFVVDDNPIFNKVITDFLKTKKIGRIRSFTSASDCLSRIVEKPDLILLDYCLFPKNGFEVMQDIKRYYPETDFIFISGKDDKNSAEVVGTGGYDCIVKDENVKDSLLKKITERLNASVKNKKVFHHDSSFYF